MHRLTDYFKRDLLDISTVILRALLFHCRITCLMLRKEGCVLPFCREDEANGGALGDLTAPWISGDLPPQRLWT